MIETNFGGVRSFTDLHLIQQKVEVSPAEPKLNVVDIPGADGSKDLSELPAGRITYKDRKIKWTFALYPGDDWQEKCDQVSNTLNGKSCKITLYDDPWHYYEGRITIKSYKKDNMLRQITVEAVVRPYRLKIQPTAVQTTLTTWAQTINLHNSGKPVPPELELSAGEAEIVYNGVTYAIHSGKVKIGSFVILHGESTATVRAISGGGTLTITYHEGVL